MCLECPKAATQTAPASQGVLGISFQTSAHAQVLCLCIPPRTYSLAELTATQWLYRICLDALSFLSLRLYFKGTGKTSTILAVAKEFYGNAVRTHVLEVSPYSSPLRFLRCTDCFPRGPCDWPGTGSIGLIRPGVRFSCLAGNSRSQSSRQSKWGRLDDRGSSPDSEVYIRHEALLYLLASLCKVVA